MAKKFDGGLTVLACVYKKPPRFVFFDTTKDKQDYQKTKKRISKTLQKLEKMANDVDIPIKTKAVLATSISDWIINFTQKQRTDLLILDHPHLSEFENKHFEDIVKSITNEIKTPVLLLRS